MVQKIGRYDILGQLATGGMAEILLGRLVGPSGFERVVVIKRILPHLARERALVEMFLDEARIVARIRHPNVVQVHELGGEGSELYLAMEYLEGESVSGLLRRLYTQGDGLDHWISAHIVAEACRGLHAAHELTDGEIPLDLVHRDVSPQNLFVTYGGGVKVLDFGIAKVADRSAQTEAGQVKGKFAYMSPEQCQGKALDRGSDIFALGAVLYELLTGRRLFKRATALMTMKAITEHPVTPPSSLASTIPAALEAVCLRALARRRQDRYADAAEMRRELVAAMRAMGREEDPEEALGRLMHQLFAGRIEDKQEMLRKARLEASLSHIPAAELDDSIELPAVDEHVEIPTASDVPARATAPRRGWVAWTMGGLTAALGVAALLVFATTRPVAAPPVDLAVSAPRGPLPPAPAAPSATALPEEPLPPSLSSDVALRIETLPPGARVSIEGRDLGTTPLDTRFPRGSRPIEIVLRRPGFLPLTTSTLPDVDQRLVLTLRGGGQPSRTSERHRVAPTIEKLP